MRLKRLTVRAFRGYVKEETFDLDSPVIILTGPNGRGKTSLFDAIQWALLGKLSRLTGSRDSQGTDFIGNAFAAPEDLAVELVFRQGEAEVTVQRTRAGLRVRTASSSAEGPAAEQLLHELLLLQPLDADAFYKYLTRTHLLEQETLLAFLREDRPTDRFRLLSTFLGLSAISDKARFLQEAVRNCEERAKEATGELGRATSRVAEIEGKLETARALAHRTAEPQEQQSVIEHCHRLISQVQVLTSREIPLPGNFAKIAAACKDAGSALGAAMQRWQSDQATLTQLLARSRDWDALVQEHQALMEDLEQAKASESAFQPQLSEAREVLNGAAVALEELQQLIRSSAGEQSELVKFLEEGKKLAEGREACPLCGQPIKYTDLADHVNGELNKVSNQARLLAERQQQAEAAWKAANLQHDELTERREVQGRRMAEALTRISRSALNQLSAELARLDIQAEPPSELGSRISQRIGRLGDYLTEGERLRSDLEQVAAAADAIGRSQLIQALEPDLAAAKAAAEAAQKEHAALGRAQRNLELLRRKIQGVERELVEELLQQYEPVWQEFYYRIQPHPLFTRLRLRLSQGEERGVYFEVQPEGNGQSKRANMIFSGGQSAGVMVVLFLTLHLHQNWTRLETVMLDDPLQSLDDVNVLGLVDLLRFFAEHRQLILSTHDDRFAGMLLHKFRSLQPGQPIVRYAFEGLTRMGPVIRREESTPTRAAREAMYLTGQGRGNGHAAPETTH